MATEKTENIKSAAQVPTCEILGVRVAAVDMDWTLNFTHQYLNELRGEYICATNVHAVIESSENPEYCAVQNGAVLAVPDGGPLATVGRRRGFEKMRRTTGPSYMEEILNVSAERGYRHYFYGSTEETLAKMAQVLATKYPDVQIAGMYSPPFRPLAPEEDAEAVARINETKPDFVWVALGAPKQEFWMANHYGKMDGVMVGVGAAFDYLAGNLKRAPLWLQNADLEWVFRLWQEPKRLFARYLVTNTKFVWHVLVRRK